MAEERITHITRGTDLARALGPDHAAAANAIDAMKDQLLIVLIRRLGGEADIPVSEIDDTGGCLLSMSLNDGVFHFELGRKS